MQKQESIEQIKNFMLQNEISKEDLIASLEGASIERGIEFKKMSVSRVLYYIGAAVVFIGIAILIGQNWDVLNNVAKIFVTLGTGIVAYIMGIVFCNEERFNEISQAFFLISALVTPVGIGVTFHLANIDIGAASVQSIIFLILFTVFVASYLIFKKNLFIIFSVIFGTLLFFSFTSFLIESPGATFGVEFFEYRILLTGLAYLLLGYFFSQTEKSKELAGSLYGFGVLGFLGSALALGGWKPSQNIFWEIIFPGLVFGIIFLSIYLKSKAFLVFGSAFLMFYILKITAEYFTQSLGWPLALVIVGLLLIGIGYCTFYLSQKYFPKDNSITN